MCFFLACFLFEGWEYSQPKYYGFGTIKVKNFILKTFPTDWNIPQVPPKYRWVFPKIVVPQNGWFIMENPIKMNDLGVPLFLETPRYEKISFIILLSFLRSISRVKN